MWSKNIQRFTHSVRLTRQAKCLKAPRCCCLSRCSSSQLHTSPHTQQNHNQNETEDRSRSYMIAVLAGLGVSITSYMVWNERKKLHASNGASSKNTKTTSQSEEKSQTDKPTDKSEKDTSVGEESIADSNTNALITNAEQFDKQEEEIDWSKVPEIPSHVPYLLIGSGIASIEAFKAIKTTDPKAKVLMIGDEDYLPYWRPPLSKHFWYDENEDAAKEFQYTNMRGKKSTIFLLEGIYMEPKKLPFSERGGLGLLKNTRVVQLDSVNKRVMLDNGSEITFDKCLIATGGYPRNDEVLEKAGEDVKSRTTLFRNYNDLISLSDAVKSAKSVAVIGGGFLGSELAVGISYRGYSKGLKVHQLFPEKGIMAKVLPAYLSDWTTQKFKDDGIDIMSEVSIKSAVYEDGKVKLGLSNGKHLQVDHVVVAVGIEPNTDLAYSGDLEVDDQFGGFRVNSELQARSDIWAAGDCASFYDVKLGRRRVEHFDHASMTGRLAGFNMAGENRHYRHQSMFWSTLGGVADYEAVGLVDSRLETFSAFRKSYPKE
ncbi:apoptosis-inducing factor 1, mitochondrial-like, partial [Ruditapes philippinarum]|uniref:apoptosis-inducing factor 1, mitochondrial-like n=1 Tax=Ruditapes philippinarum TaxID=129788 RepID=UPI00295B0496